MGCLFLLEIVLDHPLLSQNKLTGTTERLHSWYCARLDHVFYVNKYIRLIPKQYLTAGQMVHPFKRLTLGLEAKSFRHSKMPTFYRPLQVADRGCSVHVPIRELSWDGQSISGSQDTLTGVAVCLCPSMCCPRMVRVSHDL